MDLFAFDRYADFGYVFIRIIGDAVVDERDLAGKAADLQVMFLHEQRKQNDVFEYAAGGAISFHGIPSSLWTYPVL